MGNLNFENCSLQFLFENPGAGQDPNRPRAGKFLSVGIVPVRESEHRVEILQLESEKYPQPKAKFHFQGCEQGAECAGISLETSRMGLMQKPLQP